jgi:hypothetical protein
MYIPTYIRTTYVSGFQNEHAILVGEKRKSSIYPGLGIRELDGKRYELKTEKGIELAAVKRGLQVNIPTAMQGLFANVVTTKRYPKRTTHSIHIHMPFRNEVQAQRGKPTR